MPFWYIFLPQLLLSALSSASYFVSSAQLFKSKYEHYDSIWGPSQNSLQNLSILFHEFLDKFSYTISNLFISTPRWKLSVLKKTNPCHLGSDGPSSRFEKSSQHRTAILDDLSVSLQVMKDLVSCQAIKTINLACANDTRESFQIIKNVPVFLSGLSWSRVLKGKKPQEYI